MEASKVLYMSLKSLKDEAYEANLAIVRHGLVIFTWGNASAGDPDTGYMAIKPSGVNYDKLTPADMVVVAIETGALVEKTKLRPSSDTPTHRVIYQSFKGVGGVVHTHSRQATAWSQAGRDLPCYGTTHADYFNGSIPCTQKMTLQEIDGGEGYEHNTGLVIIREFHQRRLNPMEIPAVLVRGHAPFTWGKDAAEAVHNAVVLEEVAGLGLQTLWVSKTAKAIANALMTKHFRRKHGPKAYYGQKFEA